MAPSTHEVVLGFTAAIPDCPHCYGTGGIQFPHCIIVCWCRTITCMIMKGSGLEVKMIGTVYCPKCMPKPEFPPYGSQISEEQVLIYPDL